MSLFKYLRLSNSTLPNSNGALSAKISPSIVTEANHRNNIEIEKKSSGKRGSCAKHNTEKKALIGKYASQHGVAATVRHFKKFKGIKLKESSVCDWKKQFMKSIAKKRLSVEVREDFVVTKLPENRKGRPPMLGVIIKMNEQLQCLVDQMRASGAVINSNLFIGKGRGTVLKTSKSLLNDHDGPLNLTNGQSLCSEEWDT